MTISLRSGLKIADATFLLHRERPDRSDSSIEEIVERVQREDLHGSLRPGVYVHVVQHCVANRPPNPGRYRMLYETTKGSGKQLWSEEHADGYVDRLPAGWK